jgi:AraC-like DNA-binding protein/mannose-6-phosphate isomerase-like protein (cupin superfamily)
MYAIIGSKRGKEGIQALKNENICKFIMNSSIEKLVTARFVCERNAEVARRTVPLVMHSVYLVVSGTGRFIIDGKKFAFSPGSLIFAFKDEVITIDSDGEIEVMYITFSGGRADDLFFRFGVMHTARAFHDYQSLIPFWQSSILYANDENIDLVSECVLMYTFSRLSKLNKPATDTMYKIVKFIDENFAEASLSLTTVATTFGYNEKYLSHRFKEHTGVGFSKYLRNIRIKNALFLFDNGVSTIKNVSILCGFDDPLYFSKVFKESIGVSPRDYLADKEKK